MAVIEELRKQSQVVLSREDEISHGKEDINQLKRSKLLEKMRSVQGFLRQMLEQLNIAMPVIEVDYGLTDESPQVRFQQKDYELHVRSSLQDDVVGFVFKLTGESSLKIPVSSISNVKNYVKKLGKCDVKVLNETEEYIETDPVIPVRIYFKADFADNKIFIIIDNYKQIGTQNYSVTPDSLDENILEQLGNFILRKPEQFLELLTVNSSASTEMNLPEDSVLEEGEATLTENMNDSRIHALFSRGQHLYLTYREKITDVSPRSDEVMLGRSKKSTLVINADCASRSHAKIVYRKGKFVVIDQSTNGTFVKTQGGKEVFIQGEELPLTGSGFISLGASVGVDNEHMIYFSCQ